MDYVKPTEVAKNMIEAAAAKAALSVSDFLIRGFLSGALLGFATTLAFTATKQTGVPIVGALIFPVGFILIILLGLELVTGNFALLPVGLQAKRVNARQLFANFAWVYLGNLLGSMFYGLLFAVTVWYTGCASNDDDRTNAGCSRGSKDDCLCAAWHGRAARVRGEGRALQLDGLPRRDRGNDVNVDNREDVRRGYTDFHLFRSRF